MYININLVKFYLFKIYFILNISTSLKARFALFNYFFRSKSQLNQDLFVLNELKFKSDGYFVEFGAADGESLSNTFLLERFFNWRGLLVEPSTYWHDSLHKKRFSIIDNRCVWSQSNMFIKFSDASIPELSTISAFSQSDNHKRYELHSYNVQTISLSDLLKFHNSPKKIDYLSIDTEGSEYEILKAFDFSEYKIKIITVEHNYNNNRLLIKNLLESNGYRRIYDNLSRFDDWYILL